MRRNERAIKDKDEIINVLKQCEVCYLGLMDEDRPYVLPMNFGYSYENDQLILYFHCAPTGKKLDLIEKDNKVSFAMDCNHQLVKHEIACRYTMKYESVMGYGTIEIVEEEEAKKEALSQFMLHYHTENKFEFESKHVRIIKVLKLTVEDFTGKHSTKGN